MASFSISVKTITPKEGFKSKKWLQEMARAQKQYTVPKLRALFRQTVYGWSKKPKFDWQLTQTPDEITIEMGPSGPNADIWQMVNNGVPAHNILPKKKFLAFRPGYRSATVPGSLMSRRAYRSGKTVVSKGILPHPGFEARRFDVSIADEYNRQFADDIQKGIDSAAEK